MSRTLDERRDDRVLVAGREIGTTGVGRLPELGNAPGERRLEARERQIAPGPPREGARKRLAQRIAVPRELFEGRAARVGEPEQPRALVERLAGSVVERSTERDELAARGDVEEQRVATRREQAQERRLDPPRREEQRRDVARKVIDRREGQGSGPRDRLAGCQTDEQCPDQSQDPASPPRA